jgi:hypothetical protein
MTLASGTAVMPDQRRGAGAVQFCPGSGRPGGAGLEVQPAAEEAWARVHVAWLRLASNTINAHIRRPDGRCRYCARPWPCEPARRAAFLLGAL